MISGAFGWLKTQLTAPRSYSNAEFSESLRRKLPNFNTVVVVRNMDVELRGKPSPNTGDGNVGFPAVGNEKGDVPHTTVRRKKKLPQSSGIESNLCRRKSPSNTDMTRTEKLIHLKETEKKHEREMMRKEEDCVPDTMELIDVPMPFRMVELRTSHQDLNDLFLHCPQPQPPLTHKHLKSMQLNEDQAAIIADQVGKMKTGLSRLQEVVKKFDCANKFKKDIDFLVKNVGAAIAASETERRAEKPSTNFGKKD